MPHAWLAVCHRGECVQVRRDTAQSRKLKNRLESASPLILVVALVAAWEWAVPAFDIPRFLLPAPSDIFKLMVEEWGLIQMHSLATIGSILAGYVVAAVFALSVSAAMIRFPLVETLVMPIFVALQSVPKIAIAPLILVWIGAGTGSKIAVVVNSTH